MTHDARMGWIGLSAFVADEHAGRAPVVTKPAVRFTAEEQEQRRALDVPAPTYALVHVDVDVSSFEDKTRPFQIGDRVRVVNRGGGRWDGAEGVIDAMWHHFLTGLFTGNEWSCRCAFIPGQLELIEAVPQPVTFTSTGPTTSLSDNVVEVS